MSIKKILRHLATTLFLLSAGEVLAQEVTFDFTSNEGWNFPTSYELGTDSYSKNGYTITLYSTTTSYGYKYGVACLMLGQKGATLTFPKFDFDVEKIEVTGTTQASAKVKQNIFVGATAVSTETTGAKGVTNTYIIDNNYQTAGKQYVLKITNANTTQIEKINIYKSSKLSPDLSFEKKVYSLFLNEAFTAPTLNNKYGVTVTYSSSDTNVATVNETSGALDIKSAGLTTITASFEGDDTHTQQKAFYILNVIDPEATSVSFDFTNPDVYGYYAEVTDNNVRNIEVGNSVTSGIVTITAIAKDVTDLRFYRDKSKVFDFRAYKGTVFNVSVPDGYMITDIVFKASPFNGTIGDGTANGKTWSGLAGNVDVSFTDASYMSALTVTYKKVDYTFDEKATNTFTATTDALVQLKRTLSNEYWNTFCCPFSISAEQINSTFGKGTQISQYTGDEGNLMNFEKTTSIEAGVAYLIKPAKKVVNPAFNGVTIAENVTPATSIGTNYLYNGVINTTQLDASTDLFITTSGKVSTIASATTTIYGMRAYIRAVNGTSSAKELSLKLDDETTGITLVDGQPVFTTGKVYNLHGQLVGLSISDMKPGLYIVGGKKVIR